MHFIFLILQISLVDYGFCVFSDSSKIEFRLKHLIRSWFQLTPVIRVFTNKYQETIFDKLVLDNNHLNMTFHVSLTISSDPNEQKKEIQSGQIYVSYINSIRDFYKKEPSKQWYIICDDNIYFNPQQIERYLQHVDPSENIAIGYLFGQPIGFTNDNLIPNFPKNLNESLKNPITALIISKQMMKHFYIHSFNPKTIYIGDSELSSKIRNGNRVFFPVDPYTQAIIKWPILGQIFPFYIIDDSDNSSFFGLFTSFPNLTYVNWDNFAGRTFNIGIGYWQKMMLFEWGKKICLNEICQYSTSEINEIQIHKENEDLKNLKGYNYYQRYGEFTLKLRCNQKLNYGEFLFEYFDGRTNHFSFDIYCPKPRPFLVNYPGDHSPSKHTNEAML